MHGKYMCILKINIIIISFIKNNINFFDSTRRAECEINTEKRIAFMAPIKY